MTVATNATQPVVDDSERINVITIYSQLNQSEQECFIYRVVKIGPRRFFCANCFTGFRPVRRGGALAPRARVCRKGKVWVSRTKEQWKDDQKISRGQIETIHKQIQTLGLCEVNYFRFGRDRTTHYSLVFSRWLKLLRDDLKVQALVSAKKTTGGNGTNTGNPGSIPPVVSGIHPSRVIREAPWGGPPLDQVSGKIHSTTTTVSSPDGGGRDANASLEGFAPQAPRPPRVSQDAVVLTPEETAAVKTQETQSACMLTLARKLIRVEEEKGEHEALRVARKTFISDTLFQTACFLLLWHRNYEDEFGPCNLYPDGVQTALRLFSVIEDDCDERTCLTRRMLLSAWQVPAKKVDGFDPLYISRKHSRNLLGFCRNYDAIKRELVSTGRLLQARDLEDEDADTSAA